MSRVIGCLGSAVCRCVPVAYLTAVVYLKRVDCGHCIETVVSGFVCQVVDDGEGGPNLLPGHR